MATVPLSLEEIFHLAKKTLIANGCDEETSDTLSILIKNDERDKKNWLYERIFWDKDNQNR